MVACGAAHFSDAISIAACYDDGRDSHSDRTHKFVEIASDQLIDVDVSKVLKFAIRLGRHLATLNENLPHLPSLHCVPCREETYRLKFMRESFHVTKKDESGTSVEVPLPRSGEGLG